MAEENGDDLVQRMWKQHFPKDKEMPKTVTVDARDFARLLEGYGYWRQRLHDPEMDKARQLILRVAGQLKEKEQAGCCHNPDGL